MTAPRDQSHWLIDADTHVNEPPNLWSSRLPERFRSRAPRMEHFDEGDAWVLEGVKDPINFGFNACAGMPPEKARGWIRWDEIRPGGHDPKARLVEMDQAMTDANVLFPTPRLSHSIIANTDADFHLALVQAYNDWLSEYCEYAPDRLGGSMLLPNRGVDMALAEIERVASRRGISSALIGCFPHGDLEISEEDDRIWKALAEREIPVVIHVSMINEMPGGHKGKLPGDVRFYDAPTRILQFVLTGVFDRVPDLKVVVAETDIGWLPYFKEQVDDRFRRMGGIPPMNLKAPPSAYIEEYFYFTYITDHHGVLNRHSIGVDRIMWSSDYPHTGSNWPNPWRTIAAEYAGVPRAERELMLMGNAKKLFHFGR